MGYGPITVNLLSVIFKTAAVFDFDTTALIILGKGDTTILVYLTLDLEGTILVLPLALDRVFLDLERLEGHRVLAAVLHKVAPPNAALFGFGFRCRYRS
jgi:voltage-gated potassium channel Kch